MESLDDKLKRFWITFSVILALLDGDKELVWKIKEIHTLKIINLKLNFV
jgi:hypothetical protein